MAEVDDQDDEDLLKPGEVLDGRYRVEEELGRGGIGVVYKAYDLENHIFVAVKMLLDKWGKDRKMVARFLREGKLAIRAQHPYIVLVREIRRRDGSGTPYIVMEFIEGKPLLERLKAARDRGERIGLGILPIARQLASVLAACHARSIVHRDLKPANILTVLDEDAVGGERVKLVDFGIAKMFTTDEEYGTQTSMGQQQPGTPAYMAPEQFSTLEKDADPAKMDVYSLGVILYQAMAGKLPLYSRHPMGMMAQVLHTEPEPLLNIDPSLPEELAQLVHEMLAKDPTKRPTMDQVRERLKSRAEVVSVRPTVEINALVPAPASEGSLARTADDPAQPGAQSTAPPALNTPVKSVGERSTEPQPAESIDGALSSGGRGTGQQLTGAETRDRRRRQKRILAGGCVALLLAGAGVATWRTLLPQQRAVVQGGAPPPKTPEPSPPPTVAPSVPAAPPAQPPPLQSDTEVKESAKAVSEPTTHKKCSAVQPTTACIAGALSEGDKPAILAALEEADIKLCLGDSLTVVAKPDLTVTAASGVRKNKQQHFQMALRGSRTPITFRGEVLVKCAKR